MFRLPSVSSSYALTSGFQFAQLLGKQPGGDAFHLAGELVKAHGAFKQVEQDHALPFAHDGADLVPKPTAAEIPLFITGSSRQSIEWIAENSHGWITYPRRPDIQRRFVQGWQEAVQAACGQEVFKPFSQSLFIDLLEDPAASPKPMHLGYRLGRNALMNLLQLHDAIGVNHIMLNLKYGRRDAGDVIAELAEHVLPHFPYHNQPS